MRRYLSELGDITENQTKLFLESVVLNLACLVVSIVLFELTEKSDDYDMSILLYGGIDGEITPFLMYSNYIWGRILCILVSLVPSIQWYYVLQCLLMLVALICFTYLILQNNIPISILLITIFIIYYDFFVRFTFSKTSGLICFIGILIALHGVFEERISLVFLIVSFVLFVFGSLIRQKVSFLCLGLSIPYGFLIILRNGKKKQFLLKRLLFAIVMLLLFFLTQYALGIYSAIVCSRNIEWSDYYTRDNRARANLQDYGVPNYNMYATEYQSLGISENDVILWFETYNYSDTERLDSEVLNDIRGIARGTNGKSKIELVVPALKSLINGLLKNEVFFLFLVATFGFILCGNRYIEFGIIIAFCILSYLYLYIYGRTQHHIDVVIFFCGSLLLLYFSTFNNLSFSMYRRLNFSLFLFMLAFVGAFYNQLYSCSYYGIEYGSVYSQRSLYKENYEQLSLIKNDGKHLYLFNPSDTNSTLCCFAPFEVIPSGFYHNIYRLNQRFIPVSRRVLDDFNVINPIRELTNSDTLYFYISKKNDYQKEVLLEYIREHYNKNARLLRIKQTDYSNIYRFYDNSFSVNDSVQEDNSNVIENHSIKYNGKTVEISGYIYEEETDSFSQNVYIKTVDKESGDVKYYLTVQGKNKDLLSRGKMEGLYSSFSKNISCPEDKLNSVDIYLILENNNGIHEISLEM